MCVCVCAVHACVLRGVGGGGGGGGRGGARKEESVGESERRKIRCVMLLYNLFLKLEMFLYVCDGPTQVNMMYKSITALPYVIRVRLSAIIVSTVTAK